MWHGLQQAVMREDCAPLLTAFLKRPLVSCGESSSTTPNSQLQNLDASVVVGELQCLLFTAVQQGRLACVRTLVQCTPHLLDSFWSSSLQQEGEEKVSSCLKQLPSVYPEVSTIAGVDAGACAKSLERDDGLVWRGGDRVLPLLATAVFERHIGVVEFLLQQPSLHRGEFKTRRVMGLTTLALVAARFTDAADAKKVAGWICDVSEVAAAKNTENTKNTYSETDLWSTFANTIVRAFRPTILQALPAMSEKLGTAAAGWSNPFRQSALHEIAILGNVQAVHCLIHLCKTPVDFVATPHHLYGGRTAFHVAIECQNTDVCVYLMETAVQHQWLERLLGTRDELGLTPFEAIVQMCGRAAGPSSLRGLQASHALGILRQCLDKIPEPLQHHPAVQSAVSAAMHMAVSIPKGMESVLEELRVACRAPALGDLVLAAIHLIELNNQDSTKAYLPILLSHLPEVLPRHMLRDLLEMVIKIDSPAALEVLFAFFRSSSETVLMWPKATEEEQEEQKASEVASKAAASEVAGKAASEVASEADKPWHNAHTHILSLCFRQQANRCAQQIIQQWPAEMWATQNELEAKLGHKLKRTPWLHLVIMCNVAPQTMLALMEEGKQSAQHVVSLRQLHFSMTSMSQPTSQLTSQSKSQLASQLTNIYQATRFLDEEVSAGHVAAMWNRGTLLAALLHSSSVDVHIRTDTSAWTLLHAAALAGHGDICQQLVTLHGADVNARDCSGRTAMHFACMFNHLACTQVLLRMGADPDLCTDESGLTALGYALRNGHMVTALKLAKQEGLSLHRYMAEPVSSAPALHLLLDVYTREHLPRTATAADLQILAYFMKEVGLNEPSSSTQQQQQLSWQEQCTWTERQSTGLPQEDDRNVFHILLLQPPVVVIPAEDAKDDGKKAISSAAYSAVSQRLALMSFLIKNIAPKFENVAWALSERAASVIAQSLAPDSAGASVTAATEAAGAADPTTTTTTTQPVSISPMEMAIYKSNSEALTILLKLWLSDTAAMAKRWPVQFWTTFAERALIIHAQCLMSMIATIADAVITSSSSSSSSSTNISIGADHVKSDFLLAAAKYGRLDLLEAAKAEGWISNTSEDAKSATVVASGPALLKLAAENGHVDVVAFLLTVVQVNPWSVVLLEDDDTKVSHNDGEHKDDDCGDDAEDLLVEQAKRLPLVRAIRHRHQIVADKLLQAMQAMQTKQLTTQVLQTNAPTWLSVAKALPPASSIMAPLPLTDDERWLSTLYHIKRGLVWTLLRDWMMCIGPCCKPVLSAADATAGATAAYRVHGIYNGSDREARLRNVLYVALMHNNNAVVDLFRQTHIALFSSDAVFRICAMRGNMQFLDALWYNNSGSDVAVATSTFTEAILDFVKKWCDGCCEETPISAAAVAGAVAGDRDLILPQKRKSLRTPLGCALAASGRWDLCEMLQTDLGVQLHQLRDPKHMWSPMQWAASTGVWSQTVWPLLRSRSSDTGQETSFLERPLDCESPLGLPHHDGQTDVKNLLQCIVVAAQYGHYQTVQDLIMALAVAFLSLIAAAPVSSGAVAPRWWTALSLHRRRRAAASECKDQENCTVADLVARFEDETGRTAVELAAAGGHVDIVALLWHAASRRDIMRAALQSKRYAVVDKVFSTLVKRSEKGSNNDDNNQIWFDTDVPGNTLLHCAVLCNDTAMVQCLLHHLPLDHVERQKIFLRRGGARQLTAVELALVLNADEIAWMLVTASEAIVDTFPTWSEAIAVLVADFILPSMAPGGGESGISISRANNRDVPTDDTMEDHLSRMLATSLVLKAANASLDRGPLHAAVLYRRPRFVAAYARWFSSRPFSSSFSSSYSPSSSIALMDGNGRSALHWAALADEASILRTLLAVLQKYQPLVVIQQALVARDRQGCTPLMYACFASSIDCTTVLLDVHRNSRRLTSEASAANLSSTATVRFKINDEKTLDTAEIVRTLPAGLDPCFTQSGGRNWSPIHMAAAADSVGCFEALLYEPEHDRKHNDVKCTLVPMDSLKRCPLAIAAIFDSVNVMQHPYMAAISEQARSSLHTTGYDVLHVAVRGDSVAAMRLLLCSPFNFDVNKRDIMGRSIFHHVRSYEMMQVLLRHSYGAPPVLSPSSSSLDITVPPPRRKVLPLLWKLRDDEDNSILHIMATQNMVSAANVKLVQLVLAQASFAATTNNFRCVNDLATSLQVAKGNGELGLRRLLAAQNKYGQTALHVAAEEGNATMVGVLVARMRALDMDVWQVDHKGHTALDYVFITDALDCYLVLIPRPDMLPNVRNAEGELPIHVAVRYAAMRILAANVFSLQQFESMHTVFTTKRLATKEAWFTHTHDQMLKTSACEEEGMLAVHVAVEYSHIKVLQWMLSNGWIEYVLTAATKVYGIKTLHMACASHHHECIRMLLSALADEMKSRINKTTYNKKTVTKTLQEEEKALNETEKKKAEEADEDEEKNEDKELATATLLTSKYRMTPFHSALSGKDSEAAETVKVLLQFDSVIRYIDRQTLEDCQTAVMTALRRQMMQCVAVLIQCGKADVTLRAQEGSTILHLVAEIPELRSIGRFRQLEKLGVPTDLLSEIDDTVLHKAARYGWLEGTQFLVDAWHLSPSARNLLGVTPLDLAERHGHSAVAKFLKRKAPKLKTHASGGSPTNLLVDTLGSTDGSGFKQLLAMD